MASKRSLPGPITILMIVIVLAALCTWILPAGEYAKLQKDDQSFLLTTDSSTVSLPLTQKNTRQSQYSHHDTKIY